MRATREERGITRRSEARTWTAGTSSTARAVRSGCRLGAGARRRRGTRPRTTPPATREHHRDESGDNRDPLPERERDEHDSTAPDDRDEIRSRTRSRGPRPAPGRTESARHRRTVRIRLLASRAARRIATSTSGSVQATTSTPACREFDEDVGALREQRAQRDPLLPGEPRRGPGSGRTSTATTRVARRPPRRAMSSGGPSKNVDSTKTIDPCGTRRACVRESSSPCPVAAMHAPPREMTRAAPEECYGRRATARDMRPDHRHRRRRRRSRARLAGEIQRRRLRSARDRPLPR